MAPGMQDIGPGGTKQEDAMERIVKRTRSRGQAAREITEALSELGENFFDEALCFCDNERDAAFLASASLVRALERESILVRPMAPRHPAAHKVSRPSP